MKKVFVVEWISKGAYDIPFDSLMYMSDSKEDAISQAEYYASRASASLLKKAKLDVGEYEYDDCAADPDELNNFGFDSNAVNWDAGAYILFSTDPS